MPTYTVSKNQNEETVSFTGSVHELIEFANGIQRKKERERKVDVSTPKGTALTPRERLVRSCERSVQYFVDRGDAYKRGVGYCRFEFHVNPEKGVVTVLLKKRDTGEVVRKGIARVAPGDVFNASIGRYIALRRALRLHINDDVLNAPQPTNRKPGDIVEFTNVWGQKVRKTLVGTDGRVVPNSVHVNSNYARSAKVVDDSREASTNGR
ncbi:hypothetical protein [Paenibacillus sp. 1P03SA]|uniref:hypothetical protein n=1 Tax=Paenibacillus sp. 1P03SA TaxID=3132294 RepID=UPI0039A3C7F4